MGQDKEAKPADDLPPGYSVEIQNQQRTPGKSTLVATIGHDASQPGVGARAIETVQSLLAKLYTGHTKKEETAAPAPGAAPAPAQGAAPTQGGDNDPAAVGHWWDRVGKDGPDKSPTGWANKGHEASEKDVTGQYKDLVGRAKAGEDTLPPDAKDYIYLQVPGLFTKHYPGYMKKNDARMEKLGLDVRTVQIDTDASVDDNAKVLRDTIMQISEKEHRQVVLTGHSKGGVDIAAALAMYPELRPHVRAVVSMQAPYGGTPVAADIASDGKLLHIVSGAIQKLFHGDPKALTDLTYEARQHFIAKNPYPEGVPTVSLATSGGPAFSATAPAAMYMKKRYGIESDGLVPQQDAILPGSDVVKLNDMDHASPAMVEPGQHTDQGDLTEALLTLALQKASADEAAKKQKDDAAAP